VSKTKPKVVTIDNLEIVKHQDKLWLFFTNDEVEVAMDIDTAQEFARYVLETYGEPE
jgi:hypothetical protein